MPGKLKHPGAETCPKRGAAIGKGASGGQARTGFGARTKGGQKKGPSVGTKMWADELVKFATVIAELPDAAAALAVAIFHHKRLKTASWIVETAREHAKDPRRKRADGESSWMVALKDPCFAAAVREPLERIVKLAIQQKWCAEDGSGNAYFLYPSNWCRTFGRVMDAFQMLEGMGDMACLFGLMAAALGVTGTPLNRANAIVARLPHGQVNEVENLDEMLRSQKRSVSAVFTEEFQRPGSVFPFGGVMASLSLALGGAQYLKFEIFQYQGGFVLYSFVSANQAAAWSPSDGVGGLPEACRRDFEVDWPAITEDASHVRDFALLRGQRVRQQRLGGLKGLPWGRIGERGVWLTRMNLHGQRGNPPRKALAMFRAL